MADRLKGKVVLITGTASGIGRASVELFAAEGAAVSVVNIDATGAAEVAAGIRATGGPAIAVACDVALAADVERAVTETIDAFRADRRAVLQRGRSLCRPSA